MKPITHKKIATTPKTLEEALQVIKNLEKQVSDSARASATLKTELEEQGASLATLKKRDIAPNTALEAKDKNHQAELAELRQALDSMGKTLERLGVEKDKALQANEAKLAQKDKALAKKDDAIQGTKQERNLAMKESERLKNTFAATLNNIEQSAIEDQEMAELGRYYAELQLEELEAQNNAFYNSVKSTFSLIGAAAAAFYAYNNPALLAQHLQAIDVELVNSMILPHAQYISAAGAGLFGYAIISTAMPVLGYAIQLMESLDNAFKYLLKGITNGIKTFAQSTVANLKKLAEFTINTLIAVANFVRNYQKTVAVLLSLCLSAYAYNNPAFAFKLSIKAIDITFDTLNVLLKQSEIWTKNAVEYGIPFLKDTVLPSIEFAVMENLKNIQRLA